MLISHLLLLIFWALFGLIHSVLAVQKVKVKLISAFVVKESTYRLFYNLVAFITLILVIYYQISIKSKQLFSTGFATNLVSSVLIISGIIIMGICIKKYFKQMVGIMPAVPKLEITGIHKYVRHPLYLGTFLFLIGLFLAFPLLSNFIGVAIIIIYTLIGIKFEEKKLIRIFGSSYELYREKVPMIIPFQF